MQRDPVQVAFPAEPPAVLPPGGARRVWHALVRLFDRLNGTGYVQADIAASDYDDVQKITDT